METSNLSLELIEAADTIRDSLLNKMNTNFAKIDEAYKILVDALLERTQKDNLIDAIDAIQYCYNTEDATAVPEDFMQGKIAYGSTGKIIGTRNFYTGPRVTVNVIETDYTKYLDAYGATVDANGTLIIWGKSNSTSCENVGFEDDGNINIGTKGLGWSQGYCTGHTYFPVFACMVNDVFEYDNIEVTIEPYYIHSSGQTLLCYVRVNEGVAEE